MLAGCEHAYRWLADYVCLTCLRLGLERLMRREAARRDAEASALCHRYRGWLEPAKSAGRLLIC